LAYVVTLRDFRPSPRHDNLPWTIAKIQESEAQAGPFTTIETITLSPVEPDPEHPLARDLTTNDATLPAGWYRLVFRDAAGREETSGAVYSPDEATVWRPTFEDVGELILARTRDRDGNRLGTFTGETNPKSDEVDRLIDRGVEKVRQVVGSVLDTTEDESILGSAADLAAIRAAVLVELSTVSEQTREDESAYARLKEMWDEDLAALQAAVTTDPGDTQGTTMGSVAVASPTASAVASYPSDAVLDADTWPP
jgi:hypothetical protein